MCMRTKIIGTGSFCPECVDDKVFIDKYGKRAKLVSKLLQHHSRYLATDIYTGEIKTCNTDMALSAAENAINAAGIDNNEIDLIIYSTSTPDYIVPPSFVLLQEKLKIKKCIGFDLHSGCAGFGTALTIAETYINSGKAKKALVIGVDLISTRFTQYEKIKGEMPLKVLFNYMFFGDGAGAVVLSRAEEDESCGILYSEMESNAAHSPYGSIIKIGGSKHPYPTMDVVSEQWPLHQVANLSEEYLPKTLISAMNKFRKSSDFNLCQIDKFIMPVESEKIKEIILDEFKGISQDSIFSRGNIGGALINAAIPISLDYAIRNDIINKGDKIMLYAAENTKWQHALIVAEY